jgi:hypothetical protein
MGKISNDEFTRALNACGADVGSQSVNTIKLNFIKRGPSHELVDFGALTSESDSPPVHARRVFLWPQRNGPSAGAWDWALRLINKRG